MYVYNKKWTLYEQQSNTNITRHVISCTEIINVEITNRLPYFIEFKNIISEIITEFNTRFKNGSVCPPNIHLICKWNRVIYNRTLSNRMKICPLKNSTDEQFLKQFYFCFEILVTFESTYICKPTLFLFI